MLFYLAFADDHTVKCVAPITQNLLDMPRDDYQRITQPNDISFSIRWYLIYVYTVYIYVIYIYVIYGLKIQDNNPCFTYLEMRSTYPSACATEATWSSGEGLDTFEQKLWPWLPGAFRLLLMLFQMVLIPLVYDDAGGDGGDGDGGHLGKDQIILFCELCHFYQLLYSFGGTEVDVYPTQAGGKM